MFGDKAAATVPRSRAGSSVTPPARSTDPRGSSAARASPLAQSPLTPAAQAAASPERGKLGGLFGKGSDRVATPQATAAADGFDAEGFVHGMLQQLPSEDAIQQFYNSLADAKDLAAADLQRNVFRNYNDFVVISKEISNILFPTLRFLESDMLYLRGLLTELKDVQDSLRPEADEREETLAAALLDDPLASPEQKAAAAAEALAKQRAKEEELMESREAQMKALYNNIDGLQKILSESKTRYLVREGSKNRYWEVSPTTFKQKDMVHLYLFNDSLVVVSWKKSLITGKARMVAETAWALNEIGFIDMKDSPDVTNAFKIVKHPDVSIYRTETLEEKRAILGAIKRITDDILAQKRREKEVAKDASSKAKTVSAPIGTAAPEDGQKAKEKLAAVKDNLSITDYRWLLELPDELDVLVAHRDFDNAVANLEKAGKILSSVDVDTPRVQALRTSVEKRIETLAKLISLDLASPVSTKSQVQENIDRLLRLGLGDQARDIFLTARTKTVRHRTRQLKFDGDIAAYMNDLAEITFRLIRNTCDWYGGSFRDTTMASGFMKWVTGEITHFTDTLRRQVFDSHQRFSVIADCLMSTLDHCQQLRDVGLDLTFLLDKIVLADIANAIETHSQSCEETIAAAVRNDKFEAVAPRTEFFDERNLSFDIPIPRMSESAYQLFKVLTDFASDVGVLMSMTLYNKIVSSLSSMFSVFINTTHSALDKDLTITQYCVILTNATFVIDHMLPKVKSQLQEQFERPIPELEEDCARHKQTLEAIRAKFVSQCVSRIAKLEYNFGKVDYTNSAAILDTMLPTDAVLKLVLALNKLVADMDRVLDRKDLVGRVLEQFFGNISTSPSSWETDKGPRKFGFGGVQTLVLDIHFCLRAAEVYITEPANEAANAVCEKALRTYFSQNKDLSVPLRTGEWYDKRVDEAMRKYGRNLGALLAAQPTAAPPQMVQ
ncbi:exocyst complex component exo84 [Polyrhizophydium stewartii]|uniref:Exocyst complex component EXO84 n=1 Tax=Polyrhizophydium stewartii TaxID=2732419 RepID=A0ABR4NK18_9FUNG